MLLRRVTHHVKDQNWFAVFIDFLIVVVGVFIGIQVANWNESRLKAQDEQALIARMTEEFTALEIVLIERIERAESLVTSTSDLIGLVRLNNPFEDEAAIKEQLRNVLRYNVPVSQPTSYTEALQSGRIAELQDDDLRQKLNEYQISRDWWTTINGPADSQINANSKLYQAITLSAGKTPEASIYPRVLNFDWPAVVTAEKELSSIHLQQSFQAQAYRMELIGARNVLSKIKGF